MGFVNNTRCIDFGFIGIEAVLCHSNDVVFRFCHINKGLKAHFPSSIYSVQKQERNFVFCSKLKVFHNILLSCHIYYKGVQKLTTINYSTFSALSQSACYLY